jgi:hypothetical protein
VDKHDLQLVALLEAAKEAEEALSWVVERGGMLSYREERLEALRAAIRAFLPEFRGLYEVRDDCTDYPETFKKPLCSSEKRVSEIKDLGSHENAFRAFNKHQFYEPRK